MPAAQETVAGGGEIRLEAAEPQQVLARLIIEPGGRWWAKCNPTAALQSIVNLQDCRYRSSLSSDQHRVARPSLPHDRKTGGRRLFTRQIPFCARLDYQIEYHHAGSLASGPQLLWMRSVRRQLVATLGHYTEQISGGFAGKGE
jgi:hypothetical protein